jgi:hypothetical protein
MRGRHVRARTRKLATTLAALFVLLAATMSASAAGGVSAAAAGSGATEHGVWWFWCNNTPYSYQYYAAGNVFYNAYAGTPGWDYVYQDWMSISVVNGRAYWYPCTVSTNDWHQYYQQNSHYVNSWGGQYQVPITHGPYDSYTSVGDHPYWSYYVNMRVAEYPTGIMYGGGCCTDQAGYWIK